MVSPEFDVVVLGAGLAGLALGHRIAAEPGTDVRVALVDPRTTWEDDRTWCWFDRPGAGPQHLVENRWHRWRLSTTTGRSVVHEGGRAAAYHRVRATDVQQPALDAIATTDRVRLHAGVAAADVRPTGDGVLTVTTSAGDLTTHGVIDTRPPSRRRLEASTLLQVFRGVEVITERPVFDPTTVGLMDNLTSDDHGLRFDYVLPTSPTRALVEATRFAPGHVPSDVLDDDLDRAVAAATAGAGDVVRGRTELGVLPMGLPPAPAAPRGVVRAGVAGGALRPATGYGFRRTLAWAKTCAARVLAGAPALGHPADPPVLAAMDATFLRALRAHPGDAPGWFLELAEQATAATFARFMAEQATPRDLLRVVGALPPLPFARALAAA